MKPPTPPRRAAAFASSLLLAGALVLLPMLGSRAAAPIRPARTAEASLPTLERTASPLRERRYDMDISVDFREEKLFGDVALTVENPTDSAVTDLPVYLYRLLTVRSVRDSAGEPVPFTQRVTAVEGRPRQQVTALTIRLEPAVAPHESRTVRIAYDGFLAGYREIGWNYVRDRVDTAFTIVRQDAYAYPIVGWPSVTSMQARGFPKYDYVVRVTVPSDYVVANGGAPTGQVSRDGRTTYAFRNLRPAWRMDFAIARYETLEADGLRIYYLPGDSAGARRVVEGFQGSRALFTRWFGPLQNPPPFTIIEIPDGWGSQNDVTSVLQTAAAFRDPKRLYEIYHEVSHFWNVPPADTASPRLEEGLASLLEDLGVEELEGRKVVDKQVTRLEGWVRSTFAEHPEYAGFGMIDYGKKDVTGLSYGVGELMFYALRQVVGEDVFDEIIGGFYRRYRTEGAGTEQFVAYAESVSPVDLRPFFHDWLYTASWYRDLEAGVTTGAYASDYRDRLQRTSNGRP